MTNDIAIVLSILGVAVVLFLTEKVRMDLVALLVLGALAVSGVVTPEAALAGFANPAVVTVWAMFILTGALTRTGIATLIGRYMLRIAGRGEVRLILTVMIVAGVLSAFMNNIGVAALMLPVVMDLSRRTGHAPSRLLMPLSFATLLGGLTTLIGTPPNLLISQSLTEAGEQGFALFDFLPIGGVAMVVGTLFMVTIGRRMLPRVDPTRRRGGGLRLREQYDERLFVLWPGEGSPLYGKSLAQTRIGATLGLNVIGILRGHRTRLAPSPEAIVREGDRLLVQGRMDRYETLRRWRQVVIEGRDAALEERVREGIGWAEVRLERGSGLVGRTPFDAELHRRFGVTVAAIARGNETLRGALQATLLEAGDRLLLQGRPQDLEQVSDLEGFAEFRRLTHGTLPPEFRLDEGVFVARVPEGSMLVGRTTGESRIGEAFGLRMLALQRGERLEALPGPDVELAAGDRMLFAGEREDLEVLRGLQQLRREDERPIDPASLESEHVGLVEVLLSPRTRLAGKTIRQLQFRERYGLTVLEVHRAGQALRSELGSVHLRLGDAMLLLGNRRRLALLGEDPDFLVLSESLQPPKRVRRAPVAVAVMAAVLVPVILGWLPISIATVCGAALMVLTGCLTMDEAYRSISWNSIFLIAGMLPLGVAMTETGAAKLAADQMVSLVGGMGPWGALIGLCLFTTVLTAVLPTPALVVLIAPVVMRTCAEVGLSPQAAMMAIAIAASASFTSPVAHPANVLVMGPGGYRFMDFVRIGLPLTLLILVSILAALPVFWPLTV